MTLLLQTKLATTIMLRFTDNVETKLLASSFLYKNSKFLHFLVEDSPASLVQLCNDNVIDSFASNDDENTKDKQVYLLCDSIVFLNDDNKYFFDIYDDLSFMFKLLPIKFIALFNALDHLLYTQEYNKKFSTMFITYVLDNNIILNSACFMNKEVRSINNYINNVDIDIQLRVCDITFYEMFYTEYIEEVIKYDRTDIYNEMICHSANNTAIISNITKYFKFIHKYNNILTRCIIIYEPLYIKYINYINSLNNKLIHLGPKEYDNVVTLFDKCIIDYGFIPYECINIQNDYGKTLLHKAVLTKKLYIVMYLIKHNIDINAQCNYGETALHYAISRNITIFKYLIENGADIFIQNNNGNTILHFAAMFNNLNHIIYLFNHIKQKNINILAYLNILNNNGLSAKDMALRNGNMKIYEYINDEITIYNINN